MVFGIDDALMIAAANAAGSIIGGERRNRAQAQQAAAANQFSAQQFATRYQTTVKDMQAAGLNPMLAYSQGGGSPPTGQQAQVQDTITPALETGVRSLGSGMQAKLASAQIANVEAETENKRATTALIEAQTAQSMASAGQASSQTKVNEATVGRITQEVENMRTDQQRVLAVTDNLRVQYQNLIKEGYNLTEVGNQIRATVERLKAEIPQINTNTFKQALEAELSQLEVNAARTFGNLGRGSQQVAPLVRMLRDLFLMTRK